MPHFSTTFFGDHNMEMDRKTYIGGSDAAAILDVSPWKSAFRLYQEKIGEYVEEVTPEKQKLFNRGKRLEPVVIEMLTDELNDRGHEIVRVASNERYKDHEYDFIAAEIDLELLVDGKLVNCEIKTVSPFAAKEWGEQNTDEIPLYYTAQVIHGQMVTRRDQTIVAALIGADDLRVHFVDRDEEMINIMRQKEIEFWNMIQNRNPPDAKSPADIKWLYRTATDSVIDADDDLIDLCEKLKNLNADHKSCEALITTTESKIKAIMAESSVLVDGRKRLLTWKNNKDSQKIDWKKAFHALSSYSDEELVQRIVAENTETVQGARVFRLSK